MKLKEECSFCFVSRYEVVW